MTALSWEKLSVILMWYTIGKKGRKKERKTGRNKKPSSFSSLQTLIMRINWVEGRSFVESHVTYSVTCFFLRVMLAMSVYFFSSWVPLGFLLLKHHSLSYFLAYYWVSSSQRSKMEREKRHHQSKKMNQIRDPSKKHGMRQVCWGQVFSLDDTIGSDLLLVFPLFFSTGHGSKEASKALNTWDNESIDVEVDPPVRFDVLLETKYSESSTVQGMTPIMR